jgi:hypothetical protein
VIVVPAGAVKEWPEALKPAYVRAMSRLLMPAVDLPPLGQAAYALPRSPMGTHAALL